MRTCIECKAEQPLEKFLPIKRGKYNYRDSRCDECRRIACICRNMAITRAEYDELEVASDGICFMCQRKFGPTVGMAVDHCHSTGHLRSAICGSCNTGLGLFRDNPDALERAVAYLRSWKSRHESMPVDEACIRREQNMEKIRRGRKAA